MYPGFFVAKLGGDSVKELFKVNFSAKRLKLADHVEDCGVFALEPETLHG